MGITLDEEAPPRYVCLACGVADEPGMRERLAG
jgi:hypothetical protein